VEAHAGADEGRAAADRGGRRHRTRRRRRRRGGGGGFKYDDRLDPRVREWGGRRGVLPARRQGSGIPAPTGGGESRRRRRRGNGRRRRRRRRHRPTGSVPGRREVRPRTTGRLPARVSGGEAPPVSGGGHRARARRDPRRRGGRGPRGARRLPRRIAVVVQWRRTTGEDRARGHDIRGGGGRPTQQAHRCAGVGRHGPLHKARGQASRDGRGERRDVRGAPPDDDRG